MTYQVQKNLSAEENSKEIRRLFNLEHVGEYGAPEVVRNSGYKAWLLGASNIISLLILLTHLQPT